MPPNVFQYDIYLGVMELVSMFQSGPICEDPSERKEATSHMVDLRIWEEDKMHGRSYPILCKFPIPPQYMKTHEVSVISSILSHPHNFSIPASQLFPKHEGPPGPGHGLEQEEGKRNRFHRKDHHSWLLKISSLSLKSGESQGTYLRRKIERVSVSLQVAGKVACLYLRILVQLNGDPMEPASVKACEDVHTYKAVTSQRECPSRSPTWAETIRQGLRKNHSP